MQAEPLVLFADPEAYSRMRELLEHSGYGVAECDIEALPDTAALRRPLVIIVDAQLVAGPRAGVLDVLRTSSTAGIPIILTSKVKREKLPFPTNGLQLFSRPVDKEKLFLAINAVDFSASDSAQPKAS